LAWVFHRRKGLSDDWARVAESSLAWWGSFSADEQTQLADIADWLLRHKHWEAAHGFELSDEILTVLALSAAVLVLGLDTDYYREVSAIVVFPTTIMSRGEYAGPVRGTVTDGVVPVLGQAHDRRGAILIAWDEARDAALNPGHGRNVVFHEFAHKLDMLDDVTDGTPPLPKEQMARWVAVCTEAYESLQSGAARPPLDPYGATNPAEFFAVATEAFFDAPVALRTNEPDVYEVLAAFYNQDPAVRSRRAPS
jgi:Mlc titration factor MtfA (ptsG expression regulator)